METHLPVPDRAVAQAGFSLIEVLVALLVLTIGLLGVAGMQLQSLQSNNEASQRSQAVWLAQELVERMRANPDGVASGIYKTASDAANLCTNPPPKCAEYHNGTAEVAAQSCNAGQMAAFDVWELRCDYSNAANVSDGSLDFLRGGSLTVTCDNFDGTSGTCPAGDTYTVTVCWFGKAENVSGACNPANNQSVSFQVLP